MNAEKSTGSAARLPLAERARQGLLAGEPELSLLEILALEHPADPQARRALGAAIRAAIQYGDLPAREQRHEQRRLVQPLMHPPGTWTLGAGDPPPRLVTDVSFSVSLWIEKEAFRQWRAQCPASLLSALSQIQKWLGAPTADRLPLAERARQGLLALEHSLPLVDILWLEYATDSAARERLREVIQQQIDTGHLPATRCAEQWIDRDTYRIRRKGLGHLLALDNAIHGWLGLSAIPFADIEQRELLTLEEELSIDDILYLECGDHSELRQTWETRLFKSLCKDFCDTDCLPSWIMTDGDALPGLHFVAREDYRQWRNRQTNPPVCSRIDLWLGATPMPEPSLPDSLPEPSLPADSLVASRRIALVEAENDALVSLRRELKREPDFVEFWDYLTKRSDKGVIADFDNETLYWIGKTGKSCKTAKRTLQNRLTAAKKRNPFTPS